MDVLAAVVFEVCCVDLEAVLGSLEITGGRLLGISAMILKSPEAVAQLPSMRML